MYSGNGFILLLIAIATKYSLHRFDHHAQLMIWAQPLKSNLVSIPVLEPDIWLPLCVHARKAYNWSPYPSLIDRRITRLMSGLHCYEARKSWALWPFRSIMRFSNSWFLPIPFHLLDFNWLLTFIKNLSQKIGHGTTGA